MAQWVEACAANAIAAEDVIRFDHGGKTYAIYRSSADEYFATDGFCTHENVHLAEGFASDDLIECPKHNSSFNTRPERSRDRLRASTSRLIPVRVENDRVLIEI
jgi:3-phenylpropionate/trans-cinnamate dioxygenase ferredoxin subunit